jgi:phage-related protein
MTDANVRIIMSAVTEAAQESIEEVGDEILGTSEDAAVGQTTLDQFSDEMDEAARAALTSQTAIGELADESRGLALQTAILQEQLEKVGDEMTANTAKATGLAGAFSTLSLGTAGVNLNFGRLSATTVAALIPALVALSSVLAPLVVVFGALAAGATALAGAFGLVIGSGALAYGEDLAEQNREQLKTVNDQIEALEEQEDALGGLTDAQAKRLSQLEEQKDKLEDATSAGGALKAELAELGAQAKDALAEFGEAFAPLIEDALDALPQLGREVLNSVGGMEEFAEALREFGQIAMEVIPAATGFMFDLARAALPIFQRFVSFLQDNGSAAMSAFGETVRELTDEGRALLDAVIEFAPTFLEFGTELLEFLVPALVRFINVFDKLFERLLEPPEGGFIDTLRNALAEIRPEMNAVLQAVREAIPPFVDFASTLVEVGVIIFEALAPPITDLIDLVGRVMTRFNNSAAIDTLIGGLKSAAPVVAQFGSALVDIGGTLFDIVFPAVEVVAKVFGEFLKAISPVVSFLISTFKPAVDGVMGAFAKRVKVGAGVLLDFVDNATVGFAAVGDALSGLKPVFNFIIDIIQTGLANAFELIKGVAKTVAALLRGDFAGAWEAITDTISNVVDNVVSLLTDWNIIGIIKDVFTGVFDFMMNFWFDTLPSIIKDGLQFLLAVVISGLNRVFNGFADIWNGILEFIDSFWGGVFDLVEAGVNGFIDFINGLVDQVNRLPKVNIDAELGEFSVERPDVSGALGVEQRETEVQAILEEMQGEGGETNVTNNIDVQTDSMGDNPERASRQLADQITKETRKRDGTT